MSNVTFRYEKSRSEKTKNGKMVKKEGLIDGEKGLSFSFLKKEGDDNSKFYKIYAKSEDGKKFEVQETKGEKKTTKEMTKSEFMKMVKASKDLAFVVIYMDKGPIGLN